MRILFVDDEIDLLDAIESRLRRMRKIWKMEFVEGGPAAIEALKGNTYDVLVTDMRMPVVDGFQLLNIVKQEYPEMIRIVLTGQTNSEYILKALSVAHQVLAKPCDTELIVEAIHRVSKLKSRIASADIRRVVHGITELEMAPRVYNRLTILLSSGEPEVSEVAELIETESVISAKVIQLVNSSAFGLNRVIESVHEAVSYLGLDFIRCLVLHLELMQLADGRVLAKSFNITDFQKKSLRNSKMALSLINEHGNKSEAGLAQSAGLMHDIGRLVMAVYLPEQFEQCVQYAQTNTVTLYQAEQQVLGFNSGCLGAYLFGLWSMPYSLVDALCYQSCPSESEETEFGPIGAVHLAECFVNKAKTAAELDEYEVDRLYVERVGACQWVSELIESEGEK